MSAEYQPITDEMIDGYVSQGKTKADILLILIGAFIYDPVDISSRTETPIKEVLCSQFLMRATSMLEKSLKLEIEQLLLAKNDNDAIVEAIRRSGAHFEDTSDLAVELEKLDFTFDEISDLINQALKDVVANIER